MKRNPSRGRSYLVALCVLACLFAAGVSLQRGEAAETEPYGQVFERTYTSSVDGVPLPCTIYIPRKDCPQPVPVWVDLHALNGPGGVRYDFAEWARVKGWMVVSPWGRNYRGLWTDGLNAPGAAEPNLFDRFSEGMPDWRALGGSVWSVREGSLWQDDQSQNWKHCVRGGSGGRDYSVSVDLQQAARAGDSSALGVTFRGQPDGGQPDGGCYWVDIADVFGTKLLRLFRFERGAWTTLASDDLGRGFDLSARHNLKVMVFGDTIQVRLDGAMRELDLALTYHLDQSERPERKDGAFAAGEAGVCSYGGRHTFDNFRVQDEFLYGEKDLMDTIDQVLEDFSRDPAFRVDMSRIYLSGFSVGGTGAWSAGLHYPDLFAALHPGVGATDIAQEHAWLAAYRPDQVFKPADPPPRHYSEQDYNFNESVEQVYGGPPGTSAAGDSMMRENSARCILENALNTPVRIEHPKYDTITPNSTEPTHVWWLGMDGLYKTTESARADYAHSQYVWDKLSSVPGLTRCVPETANYGMNGEPPADGVVWDSQRYDYYYQGGGHGCCYRDWLWPEYMLNFFKRASASYGAMRRNPTEVAYKTYDAERNRAWWLEVGISRPGSGVPGLARAKRDPAANTVQVHARNARTVTLDLERMGMSLAAGRLLTLSVDDAVVESEPLTDDLGSTELVLSASWDPGAGYEVSVDGVPKSFTVTNTRLVIPYVRTRPGSSVAVRMPAAQPNMLGNPGFEAGLAGWESALSGGGTGAFELGDQAAYARTGSRSLRLKDASPAGPPYRAECVSSRSNVVAGKSYTASGYVKTRSLRSGTRVYSGGGYSTDDAHNARARIGLVWLDGNGARISQDVSPCARDTGDWRPFEVSAKAPANASYARVACIVESPDGKGTTGSAWFDDLALRRDYRVSGLIPVPVTVMPPTGKGSVVLEVTGTGFEPGLNLALRRDGFSDITATEVSVTPTGIVGRVDVSGAAPGAWDVEVRNANGERGALAAGFNVGSPLSLTSMTPSSAVTGGSVVTALAGEGFMPGAAVRLERDGYGPITATGVNVTSSTAASCTLNLAGAATGAWDVVFLNPDGQAARRNGAFTVNEAAPGCGTGGAGAVIALGLAMGFLALAGRGDGGRSLPSPAMDTGGGFRYTRKLKSE